jgi:cell division cycle protein 37
VGKLQAPFLDSSKLDPACGCARLSLTPPQDALELSDDSDIEVHPNVDKRSFIRAKQNQIHQERDQRKHQIATLKYERIINDGFLSRIEALLAAFQSHKDEAESRKPEELLFRSLMESANPDADQPPPRPQGVHSDETELPSYSKMIATLIDQVKAKISEKPPADSELFAAYVAEIKDHQAKIQDLQRQLNEKLHELEAIDAKKITSESIHTGFDSSSVNKSKPAPAPEPKLPTSSKAKSKSQVQAVEVLNPQALKNQSNNANKDFSADADEDTSDDEHHECSAIGKKFVKIRMGDYRSSLQFISENPSVVAEKETDGMLIMAFDAELEGKSEFSKQCVHQALLLQYCRTLGRDGVGLFFKRITTPGHQAGKVFTDDITDTYQRIRKRSKEIKAEREKEEAEGGGQVEQIQLHAVDPGTTINIQIPSEEPANDEERQALQIFKSFPPGLQTALKSGSLDNVNKVLGKMSVEEAEEVVGLLSEVCRFLATISSFIYLFSTPLPSIPSPPPHPTTTTDSGMYADVS